MTTDHKIVTYSGLQKKLTKIREGKTVVVVTGTFDILHAGHLMFFNQAKQQGDIVVVGIGSDRTIKMHAKGKGRPILPHTLRARLVAGFEVVDFVVILDEDIVDKIGGRKFLKMLKADKWVVPFRNHNPAGDIQFAKEIGTKLIQLPRIKPNKVDFPLSTSYIIEKIKQTT